MTKESLITELSSGRSCIGADVLVQTGSGLVSVLRVYEYQNQIILDIGAERAEFDPVVKSDKEKPAPWLENYT